MRLIDAEYSFRDIYKNEPNAAEMVVKSVCGVDLFKA